MVSKTLESLWSIMEKICHSKYFSIISKQLICYKRDILKRQLLQSAVSSAKG